MPRLLDLGFAKEKLILVSAALMAGGWKDGAFADWRLLTGNPGSVQKAGMRCGTWGQWLGMLVMMIWVITLKTQIFLKFPALS